MPGFKCGLRSYQAPERISTEQRFVHSGFDHALSTVVRVDSACSIRVSTPAFVRIERIVRKRKAANLLVFSNPD